MLSYFGREGELPSMRSFVLLPQAEDSERLRGSNRLLWVYFRVRFGSLVYILDGLVAFLTVEDLR